MHNKMKFSICFSMGVFLWAVPLIAMEEEKEEAPFALKRTYSVAPKNFENDTLSEEEDEEEFPYTQGAGLQDPHDPWKNGKYEGPTQLSQDFSHAGADDDSEEEPLLGRKVSDLPPSSSKKREQDEGPKNPGLLKKNHHDLLPSSCQGVQKVSSLASIAKEVGSDEEAPS